MAVPQSRCPRLFADEEYEVDVVSTDLNCGLTGFLPLFEDPFQDARELSSPTCSFDDFLSAPVSLMLWFIMYFGGSVPSLPHGPDIRRRAAGFTLVYRPVTPFRFPLHSSIPLCCMEMIQPDTLKHPVMWLDEGEEVDSEEEAAAARTRRALPRVAAPKPLPVSDSEEEEDYFPTPKPAASSGRSGGAAGHSRPHSDDTWGKDRSLGLLCGRSGVF